MSFNPAPSVAPPKTAGDGISFSLLISKRSKAARFYINAAAQERYFGGEIVGKKAVCLVGRGSDEGRVRIMLSDDGDFQFTASMKGTAVLKVGHWDLLPDDKRPSAQCKVISHTNVQLDLELPTWACPSKIGGKMAEKFALKRGASGRP